MSAGTWFVDASRAAVNWGTAVSGGTAAINIYRLVVDVSGLHETTYLWREAGAAASAGDVTAAQAATTGGSVPAPLLPGSPVAPGGTGVGTTGLADGAVTLPKLSTGVQTSIGKADGSAQKASNLSDVANAGTARTNLGLGAAATMTPASLAADSALAGTYARLLTTDAVSTSASGTLAAWHLTPVDATSGAATRTLPAANSVTAGVETAVKKADTSANTVTVQRAGSDLIFGTGSGSTSKALTLAGEAITFVSNGTDRWTIQTSDTPSGVLANTYARKFMADIRDSSFAGGATGGSDDSAAIQAALNSGAAYVLIPDGTWTAQGLTLSSAKQTVLCMGTLKLAATATDTRIVRITAADAKWLGGTFDGNVGNVPNLGVNAPFNGLLQVTGANCTIRDVTVTSSPGAGIHAFTGCAGILVEACRVFATVGSGIIVNTNGTSASLKGIRILGCLVDRSTMTATTQLGHAIAVFANTGTTYVSELVTVSNNVVMGAVGGASTSEGIDVSNHNRVVVTGNDVTGCSLGISLVRNNTVSATGNTVTGSDVLLLEIGGASTIAHCVGVTATGNVLDGNGVSTAQGISIQNADNVLLGSNNIRGLNVSSGAQAIALTSVANARVHDNLLDVSSLSSGYAFSANSDIVKLRFENNTILPGALTVPIRIVGTTCNGAEIVGNTYQGSTALTAVSLTNGSSTTYTGMKIANNTLPAGSTQLATSNVTTDATLDATMSYADTQRLGTGEETAPRWALAAAAAQTLTSGRLVLAYFTARKSETASNLSVITSTTAAAATPTLIRMGFYSIDASGAATLVASTASDTTLLAAASTKYTKALSASYNKIAGQRYAVGILVVTAATAPNIASAGCDLSPGTRTEMALSPRLSGFLGGQSDLPSSFADASLSGTGFLPYFTIT